MRIFDFKKGMKVQAEGETSVWEVATEPFFWHDHYSEGYSITLKNNSTTRYLHDDVPHPQEWKEVK